MTVNTRFTTETDETQTDPSAFPLEDNGITPPIPPEPDDTQNEPEEAFPLEDNGITDGCEPVRIAPETDATA